MTFVETVALEGEEKYIYLYKDDEFFVGALCNRLVVKDNLTKKQIVGWLNGHLILDSGIIDKTKMLHYRVIPKLYALAKKGDPFLYIKTGKVLNGIIQMKGNGWILNSLNWETISLKKVISINGEEYNAD